MSRLARLPAVLGPGTLALVMVRGPHDAARREGLPIAQPDDLPASAARRMRTIGTGSGAERWR